MYMIDILVYYLLTTPLNISNVFLIKHLFFIDFAGIYFFQNFEYTVLVDYNQHVIFKHIALNLNNVLTLFYWLIWYLLILYFMILPIITLLVRFQLFNLCQSLMFSSLITENEKELNSLDDLIYIILIFGTVFAYNFGFYGMMFFFNFSNLYLYFFIYNLQLILICIPFSVLIDYGFYFIIYIRGCSNSLLISYEIFLDYINILGYCLRVLIQVIRLIVILVTFYTFNELYIEYYYYYLPLYNYIYIN